MSGTGLGTGGCGGDSVTVNKTLFQAPRSPGPRRGMGACRGRLQEGWRCNGGKPRRVSRGAMSKLRPPGMLMYSLCLDIPFNPWDQIHMAALLSMPLSWTCPPGPLTSWSLFSVSEAVGICPWHFPLMTSEPMSLSPSFFPKLHRYLPAGSSPLEILLSQTLAHLEHGIFLLNPSFWDIQRFWAGAGENAGFFFRLFT